MPAADIDDRAVGTEAVTGNDSDRTRAIEAGHGVVVEFQELGLIPEIVECLLTAQQWEDRLAGPDRLNQQTPMFPVLGRTDQARKRVHREWGVRAQCLSESGQVITAVPALAEYATADQRSHQSTECLGVRADAV